MAERYLSLKGPSTGLYKEKGSKFLAFAYPVETVEDIRIRLEALRKEFFDARHHCYAYRLGTEGENWRAVDDGEPSSTGGKPIYGQLLSHSVTNVLVVVVRYFGGIKLGVGGLIAAYRTAAADALDHAVIVEKEARTLVEVRVPYERLGAVMKRIRDNKWEVVSQKMDNICHLQLSVLPSVAAELKQMVF